ncbi:M9 family metallopeptidase [Dokdonella soli]|uniref:microbial collagenase n=1 Tax=Dokdonella soli TaxID=529810 RepID=A0ABN1IV96_9GAMM
MSVTRTLVLGRRSRLLVIMMCLAWLSGSALAAGLPPSGPDLADSPHVQTSPLDAAHRPPQSAWREPLRQDYDRPQDLRKLVQARYTLVTTAKSTTAPAASCDVAPFATASGSALVSLVKGSTVDCLNNLYAITGTTAAQTFVESKMVTMANALQSLSAGYPGDNSTSALQVITFLRAGYYVQFNDSADVGSYGAALATAIRPALDAFVANAHFADVNDNHGQVLSEFVTLIDSAGENAHQLGTVKAMLGRYNASYHAYASMMSATNNLFNVLFRGHQNADFQALVQSDPSITDSLASFISNNAAEAGTANEYLIANAGRELARFLKYPDPLLTALEPKVKAVLNAYGLTGPGSSVYVGTADVTLYYDQAHCSYFSLCDFVQKLTQTVLPISYQCGPTLKLRAQSLTQDQINQTCAKVGKEEIYFHDRMQTNHQPVANDNNTNLEMVVFASSSDYVNYSGVIFGNNTNNGGIYLEGDPSNPANQARFLCYVAEWLQPFQIWNLTHEYVHYLDGRFDMYGGFSDYPLTLPGSSVWYIEGLAEYFSYSFRGMVYPEADADAGTAQFKLSQVFDNTYGSGRELVYRWGYLSVRYMFERHHDEIDSILGYFRPGNYAGYRTWLAGAQTSHDADWPSFLACISAHSGDTSSCGGTNPVDAIFQNGFEPLPECPQKAQGRLDNGCQISNQSSTSVLWYAVFIPAGTTSITFMTHDGTGTAGLYVRASNWPNDTTYDASSVLPGTSQQIVLKNPAVTGDYYYVMLKANPSYSGVSIQVQFQ